MNRIQSKNIKLEIRINKANSSQVCRLESISWHDSDNITAYRFGWYGKQDTLFVSIFGKITKQTAQIIKQAQTACICQH
jgi:hypothetical protein